MKCSPKKVYLGILLLKTIKTRGISPNCPLKNKKKIRHMTSYMVSCHLWRHLLYHVIYDVTYDVTYGIMSYMTSHMMSHMTSYMVSCHIWRHIWRHIWYHVIYDVIYGSICDVIYGISTARLSQNNETHPQFQRCNRSTVATPQILHNFSISLRDISLHS